MTVTAYRGQLAIGAALTPGAVVVRDGRIERVELGEGTPDADAVVEAHIVSPGLIDLQVNGAFGAEVGRDERAISRISAALPKTGVTAWLPTVISSTADVYRAALADLRAYGGRGATPLGLHLEGPFIAPSRAGAHPPSAIASARDALFDELLASGALKLMTVAPELDGALDRIRALVAAGVTVSLGHTDADYAAMRRGADAGATMVTHLFNAMSPFHHRAPGAVGAALVDDRLTVGLIVDEVHAHAAAATLAYRAKGGDRIVLVTDAMAGAGMPPGRYQLGGQTVQVDERSARLEDGTLAGSVLTMDAAVRNAARVLRTGFAEALRMATEVPARLLGLPAKGHLAAGADADLALWSQRLEVTGTIIGGARSDPG